MTKSKYTFSRTSPRNRRRSSGDPRAAIDLAALLRRLRDHALGRLVVKPTQLRAAEIVLDKILPDLAPGQGSKPESHDERVLRRARHQELSGWHAAHRAKRQKAAESDAKLPVASGGEENASGAIRRH